MAYSSANLSLEESLKVFSLPNLQGQTEKSLKKKFYTLSHKYHPDKHPNNKESEFNFIRAKEAYERLKRELKERRNTQSKPKQNSTKSEQNNNYKAKKENTNTKNKETGQTGNQKAKPKTEDTQTNSKKEGSQQKQGQKTESKNASESRNEQAEPKAKKPGSNSNNNTTEPKDDNKKSTTAEDFKAKKEESFKTYTNPSSNSYSKKESENIKPVTKESTANVILIYRFVISGLVVLCIFLVMIITSNTPSTASVASTQSSSSISTSSSQIFNSSSSKSSYTSSIVSSVNNGNAENIWQFRSTNVGVLFKDEIKKSTEDCMRSPITEYGIAGGGIYAKVVDSKKSTADFSEINNFLNIGVVDENLTYLDLSYTEDPFRRSCAGHAVVYIGKVDLEYPGADKVQAFYAKHTQSGGVGGVMVSILVKKGSHYILFEKPLVRYDDMDSETFCNNGGVQVPTTEDCIQEKMRNDEGLRDEAIEQVEFLKEAFVFM